MDIRSRFETLSKTAHLDVLLPKISDFDTAALVRNGTSEEITRAPSRRNLFFDEQANIHVILKTPTPEEELQDILPSLELILGAHATDAVPQGSGNAASASGKHDLGSKAFPGASFTDIVRLRQKTYVIWKLLLHLVRPRARLQRPAIYFTANLTIGSLITNRMPRQSQLEYLESYEPLPANILEPLHYDTNLRGSNLFIPESRIIKVAPRDASHYDTVKPLRGASKRAFPTVPALFSKIRFSSLPDIIIASLHLETSHIIAGAVTIDKVVLETPHAHVEHLTDVTLPIETQGGDETILLYRLTAVSTDHLPGPMDPSVSISIIAHASLDQGSRIMFNLDWQTQLDLNKTAPTSLYRWSRPMTTPSGHNRGLSTQSNPANLSELSQRRSEGDAGISFNFTAPATTHQGSEFKVNVLCNNRTSRQCRFALIAMHTRKPKTAIQSQSTRADADLIASIFNAPPPECTRPPSVIELNPDVRVGPLPPGARFETQLSFQALGTGVLDLGVLRILDLDTRQMVDVKELPDVVALERIG